MVAVVGVAPALSAINDQTRRLILAEAKDYCHIPTDHGRFNSVSAKVEAEGRFSRLMSKFAEAHISANLSGKRNEYVNVLQADLQKDRADYRKCATTVLPPLLNSAKVEGPSLSHLGRAPQPTRPAQPVKQAPTPRPARSSSFADMHVSGSGAGKAMLQPAGLADIAAELRDAFPEEIVWKSSDGVSGVMHNTVQVGDSSIILEARLEFLGSNRQIVIGHIQGIQREVHAFVQARLCKEDSKSVVAIKRGMPIYLIESNYTTGDGSMDIAACP